MAELVRTIKLHIRPGKEECRLLEEVTDRYREACDFISAYAFDHGFPTNYMVLHKCLYKTVRDRFGLKSQMAISSFKTVTARYKTVQEQLDQKPYSYVDEKGRRQYIPRTLEWLQEPIRFRRPQADLVRGRDYSFVIDKKTKKPMLSLNTLAEKRIRVAYDVPVCFMGYFIGGWSFGTGKLVSLNGEWYFHIPVTRELEREFSADDVCHVVGIDRGLRFLSTTYDEKGATSFTSGASCMAKRDNFQKVRDELQARGTKSAKRVLKRISGRENRWMSDVNHQISKTLVEKYGPGTLFAVEDLTNVSFDERNLSSRTKQGRKDLRSWPFYQFEQFLTYKAHGTGSEVLKVDPSYTSQRCPKCGRINKGNRHHEQHEYVCDRCGFRTNDDRVGAMNIQMLGTLYVSGDSNPRFGPRKKN